MASNRRQPNEQCLRHPPGTARLEDGSWVGTFCTGSDQMGSCLRTGPIRYAGNRLGSPKELRLVLGGTVPKGVFEFNVVSGDVNVRKPATGDNVLITKGGVLVAMIPVDKS